MYKRKINDYESTFLIDEVYVNKIDDDYMEILRFVTYINDINDVTVFYGKHKNTHRTPDWYPSEQFEWIQIDSYQKQMSYEDAKELVNNRKKKLERICQI